MRKTIVSVMLLATAVLAIPASAAQICINARDIDGTDTKDGKVVTFHMRDGRILRNRLQTPCTDLIFNGFAWDLRGSDQVCDNGQTIHVLRSPEVCSLGKFEPVTPARG